jgi:hypothetical protein
VKPLLAGFFLPNSPMADPMATITGFRDWNKKWCRMPSPKGNRVDCVLDGGYSTAQSAHWLRKNVAKRGKRLLQGLKPVESKLFTSAPFEAQDELKHRPPKEKTLSVA